MTTDTERAEPCADESTGANGIPQSPGWRQGLTWAYARLMSWLKWFMREAWAVTAATVAQGRRLVRYGTAVGRRHMLQRDFHSAQLDLGEQMYRDGVGDESVRAEIRHLDDQIREARSAKRPASSLLAQRKRLLDLLATSALTATDSQIGGAEYDEAVSLQRELERVEGATHTQRAELFPATSEERWRSVFGVSVVLIAVIGFLVLRDGRPDGDGGEIAAEVKADIQELDRKHDSLGRDCAAEQEVKGSSVPTPGTNSMSELPRFPDGRPATVANGAPSLTGFTNDRRDIVRRSKGSIVSEQEFVNGIAHGNAVELTRSGTTLLEAKWHLGWMTESNIYYPNGQLQTKWTYTTNGAPHGVAETWFEDGTKATEVAWKNGLRNGPTRQWRRDGTLYQERMYRNNVLHGEWVIWHNENHEYQRVHYERGLQHGLCRWFHDDGTKATEVTFVHGLPHGIETGWHKNGRIKATGRWDRGIEVGIWRYVDEDGVERKETHPQKASMVNLKRSAEIECDDDVVSLDLSPDGRTIAAAASDGTVTFLDITSQKRRNWTNPTFDRRVNARNNQMYETRLSQVRYSPNGKLIATAKGCTVYVFDAWTGEQKADLWWGHGGIDGSVHTLTWTPDSRGIISGGTNGIVHWNPGATEADAPRGHGHAVDVPVLRDRSVEHVSISPDSALLAFAGQSFTTVWNLSRRAEHESLKSKVNDRCTILFRERSPCVVVVDQEEVAMLDLKTGKRIGEARHGGVSSVGSTLGSDRLLALANGEALTVRALEEGIPVVHRVERTGSQITAIAMSRNGHIVATGHEDRKVRFWRLDE